MLFLRLCILMFEIGSPDEKTENRLNELVFFTIHCPNDGRYMPIGFTRKLGCSFLFVLC